MLAGLCVLRRMDHAWRRGVIGLRLIKIAHGGVEASHEVILMVQEKVDGAAEARATLNGRRQC